MDNPPLAQLAEAISLNLIKSEFESLKGDHPLYKPPMWKIYGPYTRKDSRQHVIAYDGLNRITISYPKFIMECKRKKALSLDKDVHHKDEIPSNSILPNLEVVNSSTHISDHLTKDYMLFTCPTCKDGFELDGIRLSRYKSERVRRPNMTGPYCSKECAGYAGNY